MFLRHPRLGFLLGLAGIFILLAALTGHASEVIPPPPKAYFNDYARVTRPDTARQLNARLQQFERDTSNQIVVAVFPKMRSDSSIEDYTVRVAQSWHVGQKGRDNGAVLFVFMQDRKMYIQVGYGLEPVLTDYLCHQIINEQLKPHFRAGDYDGGLNAAVNAMIAAAKGEYKGSGKTVAEQKRRDNDGSSWLVWIILFILLAIIMKIMRGSDHWSSGGGGPIIFGDGGGGGSFGGGDGGGFSGGGGSFGGGGAGGSW